MREMGNAGEEEDPHQEDRVGDARGGTHEALGAHGSEEFHGRLRSGEADVTFDNRFNVLPRRHQPGVL